MQQTIHALKGPIHANMTVPGSKSITYRALLLAALSEGVSEISGVRVCKKTKVLINALHQLGIAIQFDEKSRSCIIGGCNGRFPRKQATLWCDDTITIARFLMAACAGTSGVFYFDGSPALRKRHLSHLLSLLSRQGIQLIPSDTYKMPLTLVGTEILEGGEVIIDHPLNNQLISALLLISPYARSPFTFTLLEPINQSAIDMTCSMMAEFGVLVHRVHQGQFIVPVPQRYHARDYTIEPDFSIASYFFAATAIAGGDITIQPTKRSQSKQVNAKFLSVLEKMGCRIIETHTGLTLKSPMELHGIEVSMRDFSDTFLALSAIAPFTKSPTRISHINHMRPKELERMTIMKSELIKMGIHVETGQDWIKIFPGTPQGGIVNPHHDRHLAMAFSIIGLKAPGIIIEDAECVNQTYPEFFTLLNKLGEEANISA